MYKNYIKRILDLIVSSIVLFLLFPFLILVAIIIMIDSKGPVFFKQIRLGRNEIPFTIYKFRSMTDKNHENTGQIYSEHSEITKVGKVLRRFKIDELPQLINVIIGHMSIIGPRPCLPKVRNDYGKYSSERFKVNPGLSSLTEIKGGIYLSRETQGNFDYIYVKKLSFALDIKIILLTINILIFGEEKILKK